MTQLITKDALAQKLQLGPVAQLDDDVSANLDTAITSASSFIQAFTGRMFLLVVDDEVTLDGSGAHIQLLPEWPVLAVSSVIQDDESVSTDDYGWSEKGILERSSGACWTNKLRGLLVTYDHGGGPDLEAAQGVCLSMAARMFKSPDGRDIQSQTLGSESVVFAGVNEGGGLTQLELTILGRISAR